MIYLHSPIHDKHITYMAIIPDAERAVIPGKAQLLRLESMSQQLPLRLLNESKR
jgi:hypothetical protein